jgi:hypothetical protein
MHIKIRAKKSTIKLGLFMLPVLVVAAIVSNGLNRVSANFPSAYVDGNLYVVTDGTATVANDATSWNGNGNGANNPGETNAGTDSSTTNGYIKGQDIVTYRVSTNLNGADSSNVTFTVTLDNAAWQSLPDVCIAPSFGPARTPVSSISPDKKTIVCNLGIKQQGTAAVVDVSAKADVTANDTKITATLVTTGGGAYTSAPTVTNDKVIVTGAPKVDLIKDSPTVVNSDGSLNYNPAVKRFKCYDPATNTIAAENTITTPTTPWAWTYNCPTPGYVSGDVLIYNIKLVHQPGSEKLSAAAINLSLQDIMTTTGMISGASESKLISCATVAPTTGTISCGTLPAALVYNGSTTIPMTITGATDNGSGTVANYELQYFLPHDDVAFVPAITNAFNSIDDVTTPNGDLRSLLSISGVSNFGGVAEPGGLTPTNPLDNNSEQLNDQKIAPGTICVSKTNSTPDEQYGFGNCVPSNSQKTNSEYVIGPNLQANTKVFTNWYPTYAGEKYEYCDISNPSQFFFTGKHRTTMTNYEGDPYIGYSNNLSTHNAPWFNGTVAKAWNYNSPLSSSLYNTDTVPVTKNAQDLETILSQTYIDYSTDTVTGTTTCANINWSSPGSITVPFTAERINSVPDSNYTAYRIRSTSTIKVAALYIGAVVNVKGTPSLNPASTPYVANYASYKQFADNPASPWVNAVAAPTTTAPDRVAFKGDFLRDYWKTVAGQVTLTKAVSSQVANAGDVLTYTLKPAFIGAATDSIVVNDVFDSAKMEYVYGSISCGGCTPVVGASNLTFNFPSVVAGGTMPTITYQLKVKANVFNADILNTATATAGNPLNNGDSLKLDGSSASSQQRTAAQTVLVRSPGSFQIRKAVNEPIKEVETQFAYSLIMNNLSASPIGSQEYIDVFPFVGDGTGIENRIAPSAFNGTLALLNAASIAAAGGTNIQYATAAPNTIPQDPRCSQNNPTATWPIDGRPVLSASSTGQDAVDYTQYCEPTASAVITWTAVSGTTVPANATAIRWTMPALPANTSRTIDLTFDHFNNRGGDIYTNSFSSRAKGVKAVGDPVDMLEDLLPVVSNDVSVTVVEGTISGYLWYDANSNSTPTNTETETELPAGTQLTLYAGDCTTPIDSDPSTPGVQPYTTVTGDDPSTVAVETGYYIFNGLKSGDYCVKVTPVSPTTLASFGVNTFDISGPFDSVSSVVKLFGPLNPDTATINPATGVAYTAKDYTDVTDRPQVNFSYSPRFSIGNRVFLDNGVGGGTLNNGIKDGTEPGIDGVTLTLLDSAGAVYDNDSGTPGVQAYTVTTASGGYYRFDNLPAGDYIVQINPSNFTPVTGVLAAYNSSTPDEVNPNTGIIDSNDNGIGVNSSPTNGIRSGVVNLASASTPQESTGETDLSPTDNTISDSSADLKVDFGFTPIVYTVGDKVYLDLNNNGAYDTADFGVAGATLTLVSPGPDGDYTLTADNLTFTTTTNATGDYLFTNLPYYAEWKVTVTMPAALSTVPNTVDPDSTTPGVGNNMSFAKFPDPKVNSNLIQDFGYYSPADTDRDRILDILEFALPANDRDRDGIPDALDYDPQGYIYDSETGDIIPGGKVSASCDQGATITYIQDGANGEYYWYANIPTGVSTNCTMTIQYPPNYEADPTCPATTTAQDPTGGPVGGVFNGNGRVGTTNKLSGKNCTPWYKTFVLSNGDPFIFSNNIPLRKIKPLTKTGNGIVTASFMGAAVIGSGLGVVLSNRRRSAKMTR